MAENLDWGKKGEELAAKYLQGLGIRILARNWRCPLGEIDLVCQDGDCLVVAEVKTKHGLGYGEPEEMVNWRKQNRLSKLAQVYPSRLSSRRIDVVAIVLDRAGNLVRLSHYPNALDSL